MRSNRLSQEGFRTPFPLGSLTGIIMLDDIIYSLQDRLGIKEFRNPETAEALAHSIDEFISSSHVEEEDLLELLFRMYAIIEEELSVYESLK